MINMKFRLSLISMSYHIELYAAFPIALVYEEEDDNRLYGKYFLHIARNMHAQTKVHYLASYCYRNYRYLVTQIFFSKAKYEYFDVSYDIKQKRSYYLLNSIISHCLR